MSSRYRPTATQKRAIIAAIIRYEDEHRDELNALRASVESFEAEFDEGGGLATEAGRAWVNHILRYVLGTPDVYPQPPKPTERIPPKRLTTRGGTWELIPDIPIPIYALIEAADHPGF